MILTTCIIGQTGDCATLLLQSLLALSPIGVIFIMKVLNISSRGVTNGRLRRAIYYDYSPEYNFAQWQESGRDQGHTLMCVGLVGVICQLAWSQGDDFFAYDDNLFLRGCEYAACCNYTEETVPFTTYIWQKHNQWNGISRKNRQL